MLEYGSFEVFWDGEASLRVRDREFTLAVDPGSSSPDFEAAIVLVTGPDTYDFEALKNVCGRGTCVVLPESLKDREVPCQDVEYVSTFETIDVFGVEIEAVPGEDVAYRFNMRGTSFYAAGKAGFTEDLIDLENRVKLAFLNYSDEEEDEVVRSAVRIKPQAVIPYMYTASSGKVDNLKADLEDRNISCKVLRPRSL